VIEWVLIVQDKLVTFSDKYEGLGPAANL